MSAEKNTTMPEGFDMSFASDLGDGKLESATVAKDASKGEASLFTPIPTETITDVYSDLTHDHTDTNEIPEPFVDADTIESNGVVKESDAPADFASEEIPTVLTQTNNDIYSDLTHDHTDTNEVPVNTANTTDATDIIERGIDNTGAMENIVWDSTNHMNAFYDGTTVNDDHGKLDS